MKNEKKRLSKNYLNSTQIEDICTVLTDIYTEDKLRNDGTDGLIVTVKGMRSMHRILMISDSRNNALNLIN